MGTKELTPVVSNSYLVSPQAYGNLYGGFNTRFCTSVHGLCFFSCFSTGGKDLINPQSHPL